MASPYTKGVTKPEISFTRVPASNPLAGQLAYKLASLIRSIHSSILGIGYESDFITVLTF